MRLHAEAYSKEFQRLNRAVLFTFSSSPVQQVGAKEGNAALKPGFLVSFGRTFSHRGNG
jgi:hypothetical protein